MSIIVKNICKYYGSQLAVDHLSFQVPKGQILGLLGPNGAGKSTTMKIITGYLPADSGGVEICGYDMETQPQECKRRIGYLPENNPLYKDMYVREYLTFAARSSGNRDCMTIEEVLVATGLTSESSKKVGQLSKGYQQRVGIAQAIIHKPEVLILDEAISGLDPNQLLEIRRLVKDLGKDKAILFSSHIMQEVQAVCDHVLILNKGQVVANDTMSNISSKLGERSILVIQFEKPIKLDLIKHDDIQNIEASDPKTIKITVKKDKDLRNWIFDWAVDHKNRIREMYIEESGLEGVFQQVTGNKNT